MAGNDTSGTADYSNSQPNVASGRGNIKPKAKTKRPTGVLPPAPGSVPKGRFDWGDGRGAKHTISLKDHKAHVEQKALLPYDIGGGYDPKQVRTTVNSAMDLEYGQPIQTQQTQIDASQRNIDVNIPAWYQQYINAVTNARNATQQTYAAAAAAAGGAAPVATGDATVDAAAQVRAAGQNAFSGMIGAQGANNTANYDNMGANAALMRIGSLQDEGRNKQTLVSGLGQLQKERGEYGNTYLQKMREGAMTYDTDMAASNAAVIASGNKLAQDQTQFNATQDANQTKFDNTVTKWGYTNAEWRALNPDDRAAIQKSQQAPKNKAENTKDYYGHSWKEWQKMGPTQRRSAVKLWTKATTKDKGAGGISPGVASTNLETWRNALDYIRRNSDKSKNDYPDARELIDQAGVGKFTIAEIASYHGSHDGKITSKMAKELKDRFGIDTPSQNISG